MGPKYLIRDNDGKFGVGFARVAKTSNIEILKTPYYAPQANAICERVIRTIRRECLATGLLERAWITKGLSSQIVTLDVIHV